MTIVLFFVPATMPFMVAPLDRYDEGVTLTKAALTAAGQIPFRDYWITYGPLDTYVLAAAFKVVAVNVMVERALGMVVLGLLAMAAYGVTTRLGLRGGIRLLLTRLISVVPISVPAFNSAFLANLVGVTAVLAFLVSLDRDRWRWPLLTGALLGLASFSRPEFALALGIGLFAGYAAMGLNRQGLRARLLPYVLGAIGVAVGLWGVTVLMAGITPVWFDLVTYATSLYPQARRIPFRRGDAAAGGVVFGDLSQPHAAAGVPRSGLSGERAWLPATELAEVIREIDAATPGGGRIWVGLQRNDLVTFNDTTLYFLSARNPGTVYYEALPGLTNTESGERTIACQLARAGVVLAVLGPTSAGERWNLSSVPGSPYLDQWLAARTVGRSQVGPYVLLKLTPGLRPDDRCP